MFTFKKLFTDNGKLAERRGRKAKGPVKWQPATEDEVFLFLIKKLFTDNGKLAERQGRKAKGPVKWQPATEDEVFLFFIKKLSPIIANSSKDKDAKLKGL